VKSAFGFEGGHFSGWDGGAGAYDKSSWQYELDAQGFAKVDPTLENPRCVFQLMKEHYARYTAEKVSEICGCSPADFHKAAEIICARPQPKTARARSSTRSGGRSTAIPCS
jgi:formate dehydrogenase major subunit